MIDAKPGVNHDVTDWFGSKYKKKQQTLEETKLAWKRKQTLTNHFSEESSKYFTERSVQVPFITIMKTESQKIIPFYGQKKYSEQCKELMTPFKILKLVEGWEDEKRCCLSVVQPGFKHI